jgi:GxxExxY protein
MDTKDTKEETLNPNAVSRIVIGCAMEVHTVLGAGVLESAIAACMLLELTKSGLHVEHQVRLPIVYKEIQLATAYRVDFIVENCVLVEIKCVEKILPVHVAQLLTYLKLSGYKLGLLLNFNVPHMREGIKRLINGPASELDG